MVKFKYFTNRMLFPRDIWTPRFNQFYGNMEATRYLILEKQAICDVTRVTVYYF